MAKAEAAAQRGEQTASGQGKGKRRQGGNGGTGRDGRGGEVGTADTGEGQRGRRAKGRRGATRHDEEEGIGRKESTALHQPRRARREQTEGRGGEGTRRIASLPRRARREQLQRAFVTGVPALKRSELEAACEDFSNIIGSTASGMLYKGTLSSGVEIAVVSSLIASGKDWSKECESQYRKKITGLSKVSHKNFMNLLGYCEEEHPFTRAMVFEYAPNGTLFEHLHVREAESLNWMARLRISMGIAYCLEHMHQQNPPVVPNKFDSTSIYLTDDFAAKVSDLDFWNDTKGSNPGTDEPTMSDIDSIVHQYGIILLEILTGRAPFSEEDGPLEQWASRYFEGKMPLAELIDPSVGSFPEEAARAVCEVARSCVDPGPNERPQMAQVAARMKEITALGPEGATPKVSPLWWAELEIMSSEAS